MILAGFTFNGRTVIYILIITLGALVLTIAYRKLLKYLGRGAPSKKDYCVLYGLEKSPSVGELEFYFTSEEKKEVAINILDADMNFVTEVTSFECSKGGNIVRYDSTQIADGNYFYSLETSNQKTMKKMRVQNG
ncbi:MAG: hypothetical protein CSA03_01630 [Bacteroidetes bacterium]|nr:MAG: hypothetical protein CSA03_01630 [Bacteroidota bacterium]